MRGRRISRYDEGKDHYFCYAYDVADVTIKGLVRRIMENFKDI